MEGRLKPFLIAGAYGKYATDEGDSNAREAYGSHRKTSAADRRRAVSGTHIECWSKLSLEMGRTLRASTE
jgi:hypothetical protein